ncbi:oxidoreductase [Apostichopus japonicus]|uniref:Dehydrogenase/reductase SDR family member 6 n=1 Tax=Stichopus japonicus TaxID=307972 RepID=A0A2G8LN18_STIJA|nr:oxidoreductase [Apostichopus japonicus]
MGRLDGKVAFCTASAQGIGRAAAEAFAREGAKVFATDINLEKLKELEGINGIEVRKLDVTKTEEVNALAAEIGTVDILFNCAGYVANGSVLETEEKEFDFSFDVNIKSMYRTMRAFLPKMIEAKKGSVVNMSSIVSSYKGAPNRAVYGASKAAVIGLTKCSAADFIKRNTIQLYLSGTIDSPSLRDRMKAMGDLDKAMASFLARQPTGRLGTTDEVANIAVFLGSDESSFITGSEFKVDGGWSN